MGILVICFILALAPLLVMRAGAALAAIAGGWVLHASGAPIGAVITAGLIFFAAAGLLLRGATEHGGWFGRTGLWFATLSGAAVLGGVAFLVANDGGERTVTAALLGAVGAFAGGALAFRHYCIDA